MNFWLNILIKTYSRCKRKEKKIFHRKSKATNRLELSILYILINKTSLKGLPSPVSDKSAFRLRAILPGPLSQNSGTEEQKKRNSGF